ncbi:MAG TPA: hypothetical protein VFX03_00280 [Thermomicrobiales bacterium]|nr:hypothetical protein [Thermomicrobiales bacterium]
MGMFEEPLLDAIVRAHHEPDPNRAYRYKPFFYGAAQAPTTPATSPIAARRPHGLSRLIAAIWPLRAVPAPDACCCPAPACSFSC